LLHADTDPWAPAAAAARVITSVTVSPMLRTRR